MRARHTILARGRRGLTMEPRLVAQVARVHLARGDAGAACTAADEAVAIARRRGARVVECAALVVAETGAVSYEPFLHEELAWLRGDEAELRCARELYATIGATGHARRLEGELLGHRVGSGERPSAQGAAG